MKNESERMSVRSKLEYILLFAGILIALALFCYYVFTHFDNRWFMI